MINLLPPEEKRKLVLERKKKLTLITCYLFLFFFLLIIVFLIPINFYISQRIGYYEDILNSGKSNIEQQEIEDIQKKVQEANIILKKLNDFYNSSFGYSNLLEIISRTLPERIYLNNFSAVVFETEKESYLKVSLSGYAPTRESLFNLKKSLEQEEIFQEISFPPSSWVEAGDINFSVSFKVDINGN